MKNVVSCLNDRRDGVVFAKIEKRPSDGLLVTTLLLHSRQNVAYNRPRVVSKRNNMISSLFVASSAGSLQQEPGQLYDERKEVWDALG